MPDRVVHRAAAHATPADLAVRDRLLVGLKSGLVSRRNMF
jgi:hypothetical protein